MNREGEETGHKAGHDHHDDTSPPMSQGSHGDTTPHGNRPLHEKHEPAGSHGSGMHGSHGPMMEDYKRRFIVSMILTVPILLLSSTIQSFFGFTVVFPGSDLVLLALATLVYLYGGWPFLKGIVRELRDRLPGMMTLIAVAITVAYVFSASVVLNLVSGEPFFWELATLIDIMLLGHWVEMRSVLGASRSLEELVMIMPSAAHLLKDGGSIDEVPVEILKPGDRVLVKPGEKVPVDGVVLEGRSNVNESMLTGESRPVSKKAGDDITGGSTNGEGSLVVEVEKIGKETYLNQVIELVRKAQESKSRAQDLANRAALFLTIIALSVGAITFLAWYFIGADLDFAIERMATVMVIACPHALGLAVPLVIAVSTALGAKSGLLIRDRQAFERAKDLQVIVFDKTGTLTRGVFGVTDILPIGEVEEAKILMKAASLESNSEHPIARGIVKSAEERNIVLVQPEDFRAIPGKGVEGRIDGVLTRVVSPGYLGEEGISVRDSRVENVASQGKTVVFVLQEQTVLGALALADIIRDESREAISRLNAMGIKCMMLTGDNRFVARSVAEDLGLADYFAEVLPQQKSGKIREIQDQYRVAMVGDGINDAPALVQADLGIAIGAGTDVAVESADIVLVRNDPRDVADIIQLSKKTYSKMVQNLLWATGYNSFAIPLAAGVAVGYGVILTPAFGAALMSISTVIVAINAQTLKVT
ncbi:MAG: cadmium-translocating P-type ATPase [Methanoregulaceae archaeon]|nr:cadmium-translocating P-type ATPase [Methanoregulaceae archaeon]